MHTCTCTHTWIDMHIHTHVWQHRELPFSGYMGCALSAQSERWQSDTVKTVVMGLLDEPLVYQERRGVCACGVPMCFCMWVSLCVRVYVLCICMWIMRVCVPVCLCVCTCVSIVHVYLHLCVHVYSAFVCACVSVLCICVCTCGYVHVCVCVHAYCTSVYVCVYIVHLQVHVCERVCVVHVCVCVCCQVLLHFQCSGGCSTGKGGFSPPAGAHAVAGLSCTRDAGPQGPGPGKGLGGSCYPSAELCGSPANPHLPPGASSPFLFGSLGGSAPAQLVKCAFK